MSRRDEEYSRAHDLEVVKWLSRNPFTSNGFSAQHIDIVVRWGEEGTFQHSSFLAGGATVDA